MKRHLSRISLSLMTLGLVGLTALTALTVTRPFHLVEHGADSRQGWQSPRRWNRNCDPPRSLCLAPHGDAQTDRGGRIGARRAGYADSGEP
jgi:hypothetical protein